MLQRTPAFFLALLCLAFLASCASVENRPDPALAQAELTEEIARADHEIESTAGGIEGTPEEKETEVAQHPQMLIELNDSVRKWIHHFTVTHRPVFSAFLARGQVYKPMIEKTLAEHGVPKEFYYLAMIESGFSPRAVSRASAVGVWQFMRATGRRYGLESTSYIDERRDPVRATDAAARYLSDLYRLFGSWRLAMAGYNAGEGRIQRAIKRGNTRDFWSLAERRFLPRETMNYVPKFFAAAIIGRNPEKYGFSVDGDTEPFDPVGVQFPGPVELAAVAKLSGVPLDALRQMNPHLIRGATPPNHAQYEVWVPRDFSSKLEGLEAALAKLPRSTGKPAPVVANARYHHVRRGQTLGHIARRYRVSVAQLKRMNGLRSNRIYAGRRLRISHAAPQVRRATPVRTVRYKVRRGDSLTAISAKYGTPIARIKAMNGLRSNKIMAGHVLKVAAPSSKASAPHTYRVRRGDSLTRISSRFGVPIRRLKSLNNLDSALIYPGQSLRLQSDSI